MRKLVQNRSNVPSRLAPLADVAMTLPPLTHHEILSLVAPFVARGRHVDLSASDRLRRRVAFRPLVRAAQSPGAPVLREALRLDCFPRGRYRLSRVLRDSTADLEASLSVEGCDPGELLERIDAVEPHSQFQHGAGFVLGLSYDLETIRGEVRQVLAQGEARIGAVTLVLRPSTIGGMPGCTGADRGCVGLETPAEPRLSVPPSPAVRPESYAPRCSVTR